MKLRRELLGIILAFSATGIVATTTNAQAYQTTYEQQNKQEVKIKKLLDSEFISEADQKQLKQEMATIDKAEKSATRRTLRAKIDQEKKYIAAAQKNIVANEAQAAQDELAQLTNDLKVIETKSQEAFILDDDVQQVEELKEELTALTSSKKVQPIRELATEVDELATEMEDNQSQLIALSKDLKKLNQTSEELTKKDYLTSEDKKLLEKDQKENAKYFDDAVELAAIESRKSDSQDLVDLLQSKQEESEKDFKENKKDATKIIQSTKTLLSSGNLTSEEKDELNKASKTLNASLALKDYEPGDLAADYQALQEKYDDYSDNSKQRIAEAKKKAEQAEKAAAEKAAEAAKQQASQANNSSTAGKPTLSGGWYQAPDGYKFLKVSSGKTYGQVKNPNNFSLITVAEAANYSPGHGNGSAKQ
ncbi:hypothetical protein [Enterococcus mediterraneensis]|uniref:hypothetical protein n=1 Tax=Enterococcus mediterraneensis TaxID=2364791 RepID=UPI000F045C8E|nr:hypothetical protein [Enterococcus mediterraneensis]